MPKPANPHDAHLRLCWRICRFGVERIRDEAARARVIAWLERMRPQFPHSPDLVTWTQIVAGERPADLDELRATADYFTLCDERRGLWRPLIQSQPFACILPGRTTRERRAILSRLP